jgi:hypothetical protein
MQQLDISYVFYVISLYNHKQQSTRRYSSSVVHSITGAAMLNESQYYLY